jgi:hypothetical protein
MKSKKRNIRAFRVTKPMPTMNEKILASMKNTNTPAMKTGYETCPRRLYMARPHHLIFLYCKLDIELDRSPTLYYSPFGILSLLPAEFWGYFYGRQFCAITFCCASIVRSFTFQ